MSTLLSVSLGLVALLSAASAHPQCLDSQPPYVDRRTWRSLYCNMYRDFGCCYQDGRQERRVPTLLKEITRDDRDACACEPYLRNVTCLECSPYAAHIFESESGTARRRFPLLCRAYCEEAYVKCYRTFLRYYNYRARDFAGVKNNPTSPAELSANAETFCAAVLPDEDGPYCYPKVLNGPQFPADEQPPAEQEDGELGCICGDPVARDLRNPLAAVHAGDGSGRLFIVEQIGVVHVLFTKNSTLLPRPFLDISSRVLSSSRRGDERGLLGIAFHPDYGDNGRFFVYYSTRQRAAIRVSEFRVRDDNPNLANRSSEREVLSVPQPYSNHNGGQILFKDGYLLAFLGDGGFRGDPLNSGQDRSTLLGSVLRIDVDSRDSGNSYGIPEDNPFINNSSYRPEIYAFGLRNPWRCSVDRGEPRSGEGAGRIFCGDVGQGMVEEVDIIVKGGNYGWRAFEGNLCYDAEQCSNADIVSEHVAPIHTYLHDVGVSVTGGYVYRGCLFPNLKGLYIFADFGSGTIFALNETANGWVSRSLCMGDEDTCTGGLVGTDRETFVLSFGEDEEGELYILTTSTLGSRNRGGVVYRIVDPSRRELPFRCT